MSLRPGKKASSTEPNGHVVKAEVQPSPAQDTLTTASTPLPPKEDRIYVDNSNLGDLKLTCDEAVERILTRPSNSLAPAPAASSAATSPGSHSSDAASPASPSLAASDFPPFKASHLHTDLRLALGFLSSFVIIGVSLWAYFVEKEWEKNKKITAYAVGAYALLSALQGLDAYIQGDRIFVGRRKMLSTRIETEVLTIASPALPKPSLSGDVDAEGKRWIVPPRYTLQIEYTRRSNGGKSLLRRAKESVLIGHLGEWFTEEGEFVEGIFERRLIEALQRSWGLDE